MEGQRNWDPQPPPGMDPGYGQQPRMAPDVNTYGSNYGGSGRSYNYDPNLDYNTPFKARDESAQNLATASLIIGGVGFAMALASVGGIWVCGLCLFGLMLCFAGGIVGIVLGGIALQKLGRTGEKQGKGAAMAGIILNIITILTVIVGIIIPIIFIGALFASGY